MRAAIHREVEERDQQPLADVLAAPRRMDREGGDVGLIHHQPHPAVADDPVTCPCHEVVREPVRLELALVRVLGPRRGEARLLDEVDDGEVLEPHRLDDHPHRGSRDHATLPVAARAPRGRVTYSGTTVASAPLVPAASRRGAGARQQERGTQPDRARLRHVRPRRRARARQVHGHDGPRPGGGRAPCRPAAGLAAAPGRTTTRSDGPAGQQQDRMLDPARRQAAPRRWTRRRAGSRVRARVPSR